MSQVQENRIRALLSERDEARRQVNSLIRENAIHVAALAERDNVIRAEFQGGFSIMEERAKKAEAEVEELRAQVERYEKPVSDEEWNAHLLRVSSAWSQRKSTEALIASRKAAEND